MPENDVMVDISKDGESILEGWVSPIPLSSFFSDIWAQKVHMFEDEQSDKFDDLLNEKDIDSFLSADNLPAHYLKVVTAEHIFGRHQWAKLDTRREIDALQIVDQKRLFDLFDKGATIIIGVAEGHFPKLKQCCAALQAFFGFRVQANIYITPPRAQGLPVHYDVHDVIVTQVIGTKDWNIYGCPVPEPTPKQNYNGQPKHPNTPVAYMLTKGDTLYVPRGWMHEALSKDEYSVHITFGLHQPMLSDVISEMALKASEEEIFRLRRPLPISSEAEIESFHDKMSDLIAHVGETKFDSSDNIDSPDTPSFQKILSAHNLTIEDWVCVSPSCDPVIEYNDDNMLIRYDGNHIEYPKFLSPVINQLLVKEAVQIRQITGLVNSNAKIEIAKKMLKIGLLTLCNSDNHD